MKEQDKELWRQIKYSVQFKQFFERNFSLLTEVKVIPQSALYKIIHHFFPKNNITERNLPEGWCYIEDKEALEQYRKTTVAGDSYCSPVFYKFKRVRY